MLEMAAGREKLRHIFPPMHDLSQPCSWGRAPLPHHARTLLIPLEPQCSAVLLPSVSVAAVHIAHVILLPSRHSPTHTNG